MGKVHFRQSSDFLDFANKVFEEQKNRIVVLLPYADVQHIGSTAIPTAITKGDLDIVVRVSSDEFKNAVEELKSIYKINQPENWSNTFASFKDEENLGIDFGAQVVIKGSKSDDFVKLRDILIEHPELVNELNLLKSSYEGKAMKGYRKKKARFFQKLRKKFLKKVPT